MANEDQVTALKDLYRHIVTSMQTLRRVDETVANFDVAGATKSLASIRLQIISTLDIIDPT
jgi:hypothetical protein